MIRLLERLAAWLWPTPADVCDEWGPPVEPPAPRIMLPDEPMFRDPMGGDWKPLVPEDEWWRPQ